MNYDIVCSTKNLSTEEWLKIRTLGIGGSDAGIIAGCNPYRSIFELWQEKRGEIPVREEESEVTHFGKVLEDVVRKEFIQRTGLMVRKKNSILRSKEYPFMIADLDGVVNEFDGTYSIFEAKTAIEFKNNDWKNGEIPKAYQLQVQHYLAVTGFQKAYIAVLVGGNKFYWMEVYRDEQLIKMLVSMESHFWHCVREGEEPDVDASKATSLYLGAKYNNAKVGSVIDLEEQMLSAIEKYEQIKIELDSLTEQKRLVENQLKSALAENEAGRVGGHTVKWKPIVQTRIDSNKLKKEHKEVYDDCKKEVTYRKFSVA